MASSISAEKDESSHQHSVQTLPTASEIRDFHIVTVGRSSIIHFTIIAVLAIFRRDWTTSSFFLRETGIFPSRQRSGFTDTCWSLLHKLPSKNIWTFSHSHKQWNLIPLRGLHWGQFGDVPDPSWFWGRSDTDEPSTVSKSFLLRVL